MFEALFKYSREDYARSELIFAGDWPVWLLFGGTAIVLACIVTLIYYRRGNARWYQLVTIGALQAAMLAVIVWLLFEPTLATDRLRDGENTIALVLDNSASMAYDAPDTRFDIARRSLAEVQRFDGAPALTVRFYEMGAAASPVESFAGSTAGAVQTSIADSLRLILEEARFSSLAAVVMSSDGADTSGGLTADQLAEIAAFGVPVHTIGVGRSDMPEDVELADVTLPDNALPGSTVSARVTIRQDAPLATRIKVYDGDDLLQLQPVQLRGDARSTTAWIEVELDEAGPHQLRFSIDGGSGETELRNNSRATLVNVANQQYRILYFEGEPRWEYKFMRRAVAADKDLGIATLLRVSPNKFYRQGIDAPEQLADGFPATRDELFGYSALIIGSVEAASLSLAQQQFIRDFVSERGGSLLMLAGTNGLGNGGWGQSALADVIPARLPPSSANSFHRKKAQASLTAQGVASQMLRFDADADANLAAWLELPEIADYQLVGSLKPAAVTLLDAKTETGLVPLLITQPFGRGHAYILASGGTWRWQMSMPLADQKHETFWRQVLRALVASAPENVSLTASAASRGGNIALRAEFRDDAFRPVDNIGVTTIATHEDGETLTITMLPGIEAGVFSGEITPPLSGTWYFEALAERNGEAIAVGRSSILHESGQAEHFNIRKNAALLQRISEVTGGRYFEPTDLAALPDLLRYSSSGITETEYRSVWDAPAIFALLLLLKAGEWLLRRRWRSI